MSLFSEWKAMTEKEMAQKEREAFWNSYLEKERKNYETILEEKTSILEGKCGELAQRFDMDPVWFAGFIDGINTSLVEPVVLEDLVPEKDIRMEIDFEKLYYNMLDAKADWLYNLPQWIPILNEEQRNAIKKNFNRDRMAVSSKIGRNDTCPCGSGKKYKKCCGK